METYSMVLILELNDEIYEEINILVSAKTNTPYHLSIYAVYKISAKFLEDIERGPYSKSRPIRRIAQGYTPYRPP